MSDEDRKLSDRVIDFLRTEAAKMHKEETPDGWRAENYTIAVEVNRIAAALGVVPKSINAALVSLHRDRRVIGLRIVREGKHPSLYAIALDERATRA